MLLRLWRIVKVSEMVPCLLSSCSACYFLTHISGVQAIRIGPRLPKFIVV